MHNKKSTKYTAVGLVLFLVMLSGCQQSTKDTKEVEIQLYFGDKQTMINSDCSATMMVIRPIPHTEDIIDATLRELLIGATEKDISMGLTDNFSNHSGYLGNDVEPLLSYYKSISVQDGIATIDFTTDALQYLNNAACIQASVKSPIQKTLQQFPSITEIHYSIDGEEFTEWDA